MSRDERNERLTRIRAGFGWNRFSYHASQDGAVLLKVNEDQLEALASLADVLADLAPAHPITHYGSCVHCHGGTLNGKTVHHDDCPWVLARAFIQGKT